MASPAAHGDEPKVSGTHPLRSGSASRRTSRLIFVLVAAATLSCGMWLNYRGFLWNDSIARTTNALLVLHGSSPRLAAIGFVWMPLPTLAQILPVAFYPLWPGIVISGFAATLTTALAAGATAAILLASARALGLDDRLGWAFALLVALNPMVFLYAANGMSEGVAAPFLIGAVCGLILFWRTGRRHYVAAGAFAAALGFSAVYQGAPYAAAVLAALLLAVLRPNPEVSAAAPQGRARAALGLGLLFAIPIVYVGLLWLGANAVIMGDPLFFASSQYSNTGYVATNDLSGAPRLAREQAGSAADTLAFSAARAWPFLVPGLFLLVARALDGRLWRVGSAALVILLLSVPAGLIVPLIYEGASFGWLRFFIYPLFVAAGWGLYEVAVSRRRRLATFLVLAGWVVAAPALVVAMADPLRGQEENNLVAAVGQGLEKCLDSRPEECADAWNAERHTAAAEPATLQRRVASHLDSLPASARVAMDSVRGWAVVAQVQPSTLDRKLITSHDPNFRAAVSDPVTNGVTHLLVPHPQKAPTDTIVRRWRELYSRGAKGFKLTAEFPQSPERWRLYRVSPPARTHRLRRTTTDPIGALENGR